MRFAIPETTPTAIFTFWNIPGEPWVRVKQASEENRDYYSAFLASQTKNRARLAKGRIDPEMVAHSRVVDRKLFPKHVDGGEWGGWLDDETGKEVEYSPAGFEELMDQLPNYLFDDLRSFCGDPTNFISEEEPTAADIEDTAGN